jgi:hypothetical protein
VRETKAAVVWQTYGTCHRFSADSIPPARNLAELHAAASWLWPALVCRMLSASWNVETARSNAGRLKDVPKAEDVPTWVDRDAVAEDLAAGGCCRR